MRTRVGGVARGRFAKAGFAMLVLSQVVSGLASVTMLAAPSYLPEPWLRSDGGEVLIRAWGVTWLVLSGVLSTILFTAFRRAEVWARLTMVAVPVVWLAHFALAPETLHNLVLGVGTSLALAATYPPGPKASQRAHE